MRHSAHRAAPFATFTPHEIGFSSSLTAVSRRTDPVVAAQAFSMRVPHWGRGADCGEVQLSDVMSVLG